jgi:hypothetical protein
MVEQPPTLKIHRRNTTVVVAIWVLAIIALLEILFAGIALTPRLLSIIKNSQPVHDQVVSSSPAQPPSQSLAQPLLPVEKAQKSQENTPLPPPTKDRSASEMPPQAASVDNTQQGGSTLGIVNAKLDGGSDGARKLTITIKANPKIPIDVPQVKVQVYFYDTDGTEITASKAQVTSNWTSPPIDWKDGDMEILEVRYLPDAVESDVKFAGYVVAIYYKGDLQDYRAEPSELTKLFPLKYFIGTDE